MDNIAYLAISRAALLQRATDVAANNVANANTDGFRASTSVFESMISDTNTKDDLRRMSYAIDGGTYANLEEGVLVKTSNALDVALTGSGWFGFQTATGQTALGRAGNFVMNGQGDLVTLTGDLVLDEGGAPINIPPGSGSIEIAKDGMITDARGEEIARIGVFQADNVDNWAQVGGAKLAPRDGAVALVPVLEPQMAQGFVEKSNVNPILEMSRMITLQREYESSMNLVNIGDDLRKQTLSSLAPK
ncbi:MAG: flagellar hook-basal body protein [Rhodobacteraceae bacterium]|nr:flagellar hook-basal body protein [Paracoccaceae bacterium]